MYLVFDVVLEYVLEASSSFALGLVWVHQLRLRLVLKLVNMYVFASAEFVSW